MKRQTQVAGVRRWFADDLLELQSETFKALDGIVSAYKTPFVISGCERQPSDGYVSAGFVALEIEGEGFKIMPFAGYNHLGEFYIIANKIPIKSVYADGQSRLSAYRYEAFGVPFMPPIPEEEYQSHIKIESSGKTTRLTDVMQDASHRFVSDIEKNKWNASKQEAIDAANSYTETKDTATRAFIGQVETGLHHITESLTTTKADKAETVVEVGEINEDPYKVFDENRIVYNNSGGSSAGVRGTVAQFCTRGRGVALQAHAEDNRFFVSRLTPVSKQGAPRTWHTRELFHSGNFDPSLYSPVLCIGGVVGGVKQEYMNESFTLYKQIGTTGKYKISGFPSSKYTIDITPRSSTAGNYYISSKTDSSFEVQFTRDTDFDFQLSRY